MSERDGGDEVEPTTEDRPRASARRAFLGALAAGTVTLGTAIWSAGADAAATAQTGDALPWAETFDLADGTTVDDGETAWTIESGDGHPAVAVESGALTASETAGEARWRSEAIDLSGVGAVDVTVSVRRTEQPGDGGEPPASVVGTEPPTDLDGDGRYEDVDGDGTFDLADAVTLFDHLESDPVTADAAAFDRNCNGEVDYADVVSLASRADGDGGDSTGGCDRGPQLTVATVLDGTETEITSYGDDLGSAGETVEATGLTGDTLRVAVTARTGAGGTAYHVDEVRVTERDDAGDATLVADRAPDGSRLTARPDGPAYHTTDGSVHLFTWDEPADGARAVLYDESGEADWGSGPDVHVFDTLEREGAGAGDQPSLQATRGEWANHRGSPELVADGHSGEYSMRAQRRNDVHGFAAEFPATTEVFLSYCVKIPEGRAMPGGEEPGEFPMDESVWKMSWLMHDDTGAGEDVDVTIPTWTPVLAIGGNNVDTAHWAGSQPDWWRWGQWMRLSFWFECGPDPESDPGRLVWQVVTEGEETRTIVDKGFTFMDEGTPPYSWKRLVIPGWSNTKSTPAENVEVLYDDVYLATGEDANARLELGDDATYGDCTRLGLSEIRSWSSNRVSAVLRTGSIDSVRGSTLHLTTADERTAVSLEVR